MALLIIGGGIAGLSTALFAARLGAERVVVLEREAAPFSLSSARNAAIFRPLEVQASLVELARRSRALLLSLGKDLLRSNGLCLVSRYPSALEPLTRTATESSLPHELWDQAEIEKRAPWLSGGSSRVGLFLPSGGTVDLKRLCSALGQSLAELGVTIRTRAEVARVELGAGAVAAVRLASGERLPASRVVNAAGAWAGQLGATEGSLALRSHRRHLVELEPDFAVEANHPVCWNIETEVYFRPHGKLVLACPGDDTPHEPRLPEADPRAVETLLGALREQAPALAGARVVRSWACLRTRCADGAMAIGKDPAVAGSYWLAGLGGHGLTVGLAAGELLARSMHGHHDPLAEAFALTRFEG